MNDDDGKRYFFLCARSNEYYIGKWNYDIKLSDVSKWVMIFFVAVRLATAGNGGAFACLKAGGWHSGLHIGIRWIHGEHRMTKTCIYVYIYGWNYDADGLVDLVTQIVWLNLCLCLILIRCTWFVYVIVYSRISDARLLTGYMCHESGRHQYRKLMCT